MNRLNYVNLINGINNRIIKPTWSQRKQITAKFLCAFIIPFGVMYPGMIAINTFTEGPISGILLVAWVLPFLAWLLLSWREYLKEIPTNSDKQSRSEQ